MASITCRGGGQPVHTHESVAAVRACYGTVRTPAREIVRQSLAEKIVRQWLDDVPAGRYARWSVTTT